MKRTMILLTALALVVFACGMVQARKLVASPVYDVGHERWPNTEFSFDDIEEIHFRDDPPPDRMVELVSGPVTVSFTGDPGLARDIAPVFEDQRFKFSMTDEVVLIDFTGSVMAGTSSERYSFEISVFCSGTLDEDGYPELEDFSEELGEATLRRFGAGEGDPMTDLATGSASVSFAGTEDLIGN